MEAPRDVLAAPSHPQPYPWYAQLSAIFFDESLQLWVVRDPALVREALRHPQLRVRPRAEPVPRALQGRPAGEVFALLVRMNDGEFHPRHRPDVEARIGGLSEEDVEAAAEAATRDVAQRLSADEMLSAIPVQTIATLLRRGSALRALTADLRGTVQAVIDFAQGIAAGAKEDAIGKADAAARMLMAQGEQEGLSRVQAANRIALMQQSLDATAGLIGNAIVEWQRNGGELRGTEIVERVAREDPAIHNTRRFAAQDIELGDQRIASGQGLVLLLMEGHGFGQGAHACPGETLAIRIAAAALRALRDTGTLQRLGPVRGYRPLPNARIPILGDRS